MSFFSQLQTYLEALRIEFSILTIIDVFLVAFILYWIIASLRGTKGIRILWGIIVLGFIFAIAEVLNLAALAWLLKASFAVVVVAIPVVFQPELRKLLERAGKNAFWRGLTKNPKARQEDRVVHTIASATKTLASTKTGALIVMARNDTLHEYEESGTVLDANVSEELLLNIFFPKSPLHDGAILIQGNTILAAGVVLPLSEKKEAYKFGTRHKAAFGMAEETDALIIVVSEERGTISVVCEGKLIENIPPEKLFDVIQDRL